MVESCDKLAEHYPELSESGSLRTVHGSLARWRQSNLEQLEGLNQDAQELASQLERMPERLGDWSLKHNGFEALAPGLIANSPLAHKYETLVETPAGFVLGEWSFTMWSCATGSTTDCCPCSSVRGVADGEPLQSGKTGADAFQRIAHLLCPVVRAWNEISVAYCAGFSFAFKARQRAHSRAM
jgi:hypothetical protein